MGTIVGMGRFYAWAGGSLFIGRGTGAVPVHAHSAIQATFSSDADVRFRTGDGEPWVAYPGSLIQSRQPHAMDASGVSAMATMLVEPETPEGRALAARCGHAGIAALPRDAFGESGPALLDAWFGGAPPDVVVASARRVIAHLAGHGPAREPADARVLRAIAHVRATLDGAHSLEAVAEVACLSPERFRHLFVEETGMGLRPYLLWQRLLRAFERLFAGATASEAAHDAGFSDAAHLTRTCRRMLGLSPSMLEVREGPAVAASAPRD